MPEDVYQQPWLRWQCFNSKQAWDPAVPGAAQRRGSDASGLGDLTGYVQEVSALSCDLAGLPLGSAG